MKKILFLSIGIMILLFGIYLRVFILKEPTTPKQLTQTREFTVVHSIDEQRFGQASMGPNDPTTGASTGETTCTNNVNWGTPTGAAAQDTSYATITGNNLDTNEYTDELELSGYGFTTSGTIDGVLVEVIGWSVAGGGSTIVDVRMMTASLTYLGTDKATGTLGTSDPGTTYTGYGGAADSWSSGVTSTQVNAAGFGVALCYRAVGDNTNISIDHVRITVTYTAAVGGETPVMPIIIQGE